MSVNAPRGAGPFAGAWSAPSKALRLEKTHASAELHGEDRFTTPQPDRRGPKPTRRLAYRFETVDHVSQWSGPLLTSPFPAQVIAQALDIHQTAVSSARTAYRRRAKIGHPFLLDDRL